MLLLLTWIIVGYIAFILDENARRNLSDKDTKLKKSLMYWKILQKINGGKEYGYIV